MGLASIEDQTRIGSPARRLRRLAALLPLGVCALLLSAAGGLQAQEWVAGQAKRPDQRIPQQFCIRAGEAGRSGRVINYQDPELCGRWVKERGPYYVRVPRPQVSEVPRGQRNRDALGREVR